MNLNPIPVQIDAMFLATNRQARTPVVLLVMIAARASDKLRNEIHAGLEELNRVIGPRGIPNTDLTVLLSEEPRNIPHASSLVSPRLKHVHYRRLTEMQLAVCLDAATAIIKEYKEQYRGDKTPCEFPSIVVVTTHLQSETLHDAANRLSSLKAKRIAQAFGMLCGSPEDTPSGDSFLFWHANPEAAFQQAYSLLGLRPGNPKNLQQNHITTANDCLGTATASMEGATWSFFGASCIGTSHLQAGKTCEDSHACKIIHTPQGEDILVALASDGAGSARFAADGSNRTVHTFERLIRSFLTSSNSIQDISKSTISFWVGMLQRDLGKEAIEKGRIFQDYMCTLVGALIGEHHAVFFQIGDGGIVAAEANEDRPIAPYKAVCWPERGDYDNVTFFVTDMQAKDHIQFLTIERRFNHVALFTDGIQSLVLDLDRRDAYQPFFHHIFECLTSNATPSSTSSDQFLPHLLTSDSINQRTSDDKTLLIASRARQCVERGEGLLDRADGRQLTE